MSTIHWIELCCGSAALTWQLMGGVSQPPVSYVGSKSGYASEIIDVLKLPKPRIVTLNDPGTWGRIWPSVIKNPSGVADAVESLAKDPRDPKDLFIQLPTIIDCTEDRETEAALRLCRLAGTFGGKEVGGFKGKHKHRLSVDGYIPNRKTIAERVRQYNKLPDGITWFFFNETAQTITPSNSGTFVYIDPPYLGSESVYQNRFPRAEVLETAVRWSKSGANVIISEAEPLDHSDILMNDGDWKSVELHGRVGQTRKNSKSTKEFITFKLQ